jgi:hypothetical protein
VDMRKRLRARVQGRHRGRRSWEGSTEKGQRDGGGKNAATGTCRHPTGTCRHHGQLPIDTWLHNREARVEKRMRGAEAKAAADGGNALSTHCECCRRATSHEMVWELHMHAA